MEGGKQPYEGGVIFTSTPRQRKDNPVPDRPYIRAPRALPRPAWLTQWCLQESEGHSQHPAGGSARGQRRPGSGQGAERSTVLPEKSRVGTTQGRWLSPLLPMPGMKLPEGTFLYRVTLHLVLKPLQPFLECARVCVRACVPIRALCTRLAASYTQSSERRQNVSGIRRTSRSSPRDRGIGEEELLFPFGQWPSKS